MKNLLRSLFGLKGVTGNRKVLDNPDGADVQHTPFYSASLQRLVALQQLCKRYRSTPYVHQLQAVIEKSKRIHNYLLSRQRGHELEIFHLQHTDHFLSTFTAIADAHQQHDEEIPGAPAKPAPKTGIIGRTLVIGPFRRDRKEVKAVQKLNLETSAKAFADIVEANIELPQLAAPQVAINTYAKLAYLKEDEATGFSSNEIGFTSTPEEKQDFIAYVGSRLGLTELSYLGNAMVYLPASGAPGMVPVVYWNGTPYVLCLDDNSLFQVQVYRKGK